MKLSLLYRFRGLFLGLAAGEAYRQQSRYSALGTGYLTDALRPGDDPKDLNWQAVCNSMTQSLIDFPLTVPQRQTLANMGLPSQGTSLLAAILPMALLFHDHLPSLDQQIDQLLPTSTDLELATGGHLLGRAIAMICQEQVAPKTFIPQLLEQFNIPQTSLGKGLEKVHRLMLSQATLREVVHSLNPNPSYPMTLSAQISLALYCWLSTADSFNLSLQRSGQYPQFHLNTRLTSALSGVYNGVAGIPVHWQSFLVPRSGLPSQRWQRADALLAIWSGCSEVGTATDMSQGLLRSAIAAPGLLRPRPQQSPFPDR